MIFICQSCHAPYQYAQAIVLMESEPEADFLPGSFCSPACRHKYNGLPKIGYEIPLGTWDMCNLIPVRKEEHPL